MQLTLWTSSGRASGGTLKTRISELPPNGAAVSGPPNGASARVIDHVSPIRVFPCFRQSVAIVEMRVVALTRDVIASLLPILGSAAEWR